MTDQADQADQAVLYAQHLVEKTNRFQAILAATGFDEIILTTRSRISSAYRRPEI